VPAEALSCDDVAAALPRLLDSGLGAHRRTDRQIVSHVETCLRCQAELARYRRLLRLLNQLRAYRPPVPPGGVAAVLAAIEEASAKGAIRSALSGRRAALVGAVAATVAVVSTTVVVATARLRGGRRMTAPQPAGVNPGGILGLPLRGGGSMTTASASEGQ